jgi:hypothetical protein
MKRLLLPAFFCCLMIPMHAQTTDVAAGEKDKTAIWTELAPFFSAPAEYRDQYGAYRTPLKFYNGKPVKTVKDWLERRKEILRQWNTMMGEWPALLTDQQMQFLDSVQMPGYKQYHISFKWLPNEQTDGYLLVPNDPSVPTGQLVASIDPQPNSVSISPGNIKRPAVISVFYEPETGAGLGKSERTKNKADFAYQLVKRGFVTLSIGTTKATDAKTYSLYYPTVDNASVQPLSMLAYAAANAWHVLANYSGVDSTRIGIMGLSFGGKWAMFASCLFEKFACAAWSDAGIVFDEKRENVNYWEPWYLGYHPRPWRERGLITPANPAYGSYPELVNKGHDLHELHALMAPRPFLVSGGAEDTKERWIPLNHSLAVNRLLGYSNRVGMTNDRTEHLPKALSNERVYLFFEYFLMLNKIDRKSKTATNF